MFFMVPVTPAMEWPLSTGRDTMQWVKAISGSHMVGKTGQSGRETSTRSA